MTKVNYLLVFALLLFFTSSMLAQVSENVKETKVKIEKQVEKASEQVVETSATASEKASKVKNSCSTSDKECKTVKGTKMSKNAHGENCDCGGCKMAKAEMHKEHKAHGKDCKCTSCAKS